MKKDLLLIPSVMLILAFAPFTGFSQCNTSSTPFFENFNSPPSPSSCTGPGGGSRTSTLPAGQTKGSMAATCGSSVDITNNLDQCDAAAADSWRDLTNSGADGGGSGDYVLAIDPCSGVPDGSVWCTSLSVTAGQYYNFSAMIASPWLAEKQNDPDVYFSIGTTANPTGGTNKVGSSILLEQYTSSGPTAFSQMCRTYQMPTTGTYNFCINIKQRTGGTATTPGSGSYGGDGQGNDIIVDDIKIDLVSGAGCTSGSACTVTLPVELITFEGEKVSGNTALLKWVTATEKNSAYFSIEKSEDGVNFSEIGIVNAQGSSNNIVNYQYNDNHFNKSFYYRLKMLDLDGSYKYSSVRFIETGNDYARIVKTESGDMEIRALVNEDTQWNIGVYSLLGQDYFHKNIQLAKGENTLLRGMVFGEKSPKILRIMAEDGTVILSQVVIW
jgi:hypothetical protein